MGVKGDTAFPCPRCGAPTIAGFTERYCAAECDLVSKVTRISDPVIWRPEGVFALGWPVPHGSRVLLPRGTYAKHGGPDQVWVVLTKDDSPPALWTHVVALTTEEAKAQLDQGYFQFGLNERTKLRYDVEAYENGTVSRFSGRSFWYTRIAP